MTQATLSGLSLGTVVREEQTKDSGLFQMPVPLADSSESTQLDLFGASRTITIDGLIAGTETEQRTFITAMELLNDGAQESKEFVSSLITSPANRKVYVQSFKWTKNKASIGIMDYSLVLVEGAATV